VPVPGVWLRSELLPARLATDECDAGAEEVKPEPNAGSGGSGGEHRASGVRNSLPRLERYLKVLGTEHRPLASAAGNASPAAASAGGRPAACARRAVSSMNPGARGSARTLRAMGLRRGPAR